MRAFAARHRNFFERGFQLVGLILLAVATGRYFWPEHVSDTAFLATILTVGILQVFRFVLLGPDKTRAEIMDLRPARAALGVILFTGLVGAFVLGKQFDSYGVTFGLMVLTGVAAAAAYCFAERHADDIGEARFDTRNSREKQEEVDQR